MPAPKDDQPRASVMPLVIVLFLITAMRAAWFRRWEAAIPAAFVAVMLAVGWCAADEGSL